jgi:arginyl-tRNA synthetase
MNLFESYSAHVAAALAELAVRGAIPAGLNLGRVVVEPTRDPAHGDLATNAAMVLAKDAGMNPRALAELLCAELSGKADIVKAEIAGPGFINLTLQPAVFTAILRAAVEAGLDYGRGPAKPQPKINVEYVSANPTGPMHVGHGRGAVFGDSLSNLLAFAGHAVTREYYINDAGAQVDVLARSAFLRYREALGQDIGDIPEGLYPGDYLKSVGATLATARGDALLAMPEKEWLPLVRSAAIDGMMAMIRDDLAALGVVHEVFFSERSLQTVDGNLDAVRATIEDLRARDLIYEGRLPPPKGQKDEDWEDREQTLFRATSSATMSTGRC